MSFSSICVSRPLQLYSRANDLFSGPYALDRFAWPQCSRVSVLYIYNNCISWALRCTRDFLFFLGYSRFFHIIILAGIMLKKRRRKRSSFTCGFKSLKFCVVRHKESNVIKFRAESLDIHDDPNVNVGSLLRRNRRGRYRKI